MATEPAVIPKQPGEAIEILNTPEETLSDRLQKLIPTFDQLGTVFGLAAVLTMGLGIIFWANKPTYTALKLHFQRQDIPQAIDTLNAENIPYEVNADRGVIMVPAKYADQANLILNDIGTGHSAFKGLEILNEEQNFSTSKFIESARYKHAIETELSRTIGNMRNIDWARVHLAMVKRSSFIRDYEKSSASVMIKLKPGRILEKTQVASIVQLVAGSVPYLESSRVAIVDQLGNLLTSDSDDDLAISNKQFDYKKRIEANYKQRIENLLAPFVGYGHVKAEVNAQIDFTKAEIAAEEFTPDDAKIRSERVQEQQTTGPLGAIGIPGALTNQPPGAGTTEEGGAAAEDQQNPINSNRSSARNFEMDKTVTYTQKSIGQIAQVSVSVLLDNKIVTETDDEGNEITRQEALTAEQIQNIEALIKGLIGYNEQRGDTIVVYNIPFFQTDEGTAVEVPIWQQPWVWDLAKQVFAALLILFIVFKIARPALKSLYGSPQVIDDDQENEEESTEDEDNEEGQQDEENKEDNEQDEEEKILMNLLGKQDDIGAGDQPLALPIIKRRMQQLEHMTTTDATLPATYVYGNILNMAKELTKHDPKRVAKVIKDWVATEDE